uniref:Homing endonuclease LAGLIDADG domain-containing protein n=1 Tax=Chlamydomonas zebra TaxID=28464 RepID=Q8WL03_9CHLO|nr:putative protein [Chlamydomonas zebra]
MTLQTIQKDLIFGTLLGDGNLQTDSNGKTWRYRALQKSAHKEYLFYKYEILKSLCGSGTIPKEGETYDERTGKTYTRWFFNTLTDPSLKFYGDMFYTYDKNKGKWVKDVPVNVEKFLTARAIAYWYMDDGSLKSLGQSNAMRICTESFSVEGVKRLQKALNNSFGINTTLTKKTKEINKETKERVLVGYRIAIPEASSEAFRKLIEPFLVDCMKYKVSDGNKGHL